MLWAIQFVTTGLYQCCVVAQRMSYYQSVLHCDIKLYCSVTPVCTTHTQRLDQCCVFTELDCLQLSIPNDILLPSHAVVTQCDPLRSVLRWVFKSLVEAFFLLLAVKFFCSFGGRRTGVKT